MADLTILSYGVHVVESFIQDTQPLAEAGVVGEAVRIDTTSGKFTGANGTVATEARVFGILVRPGAAGEARTAIRKGVLDGFDLSALAYDATVYLSNTDGKLGDIAGTVSVTVGRVIRANNQVTLSGTDKLLLVDL